MRHLIGFAALSLSAVVSSAQTPTICSYGKFGYMHPGRDETGFFAKIAFENDMQFPVDHHSVRPTGDWFAAQAGATVVYLASFTERRVDHGEWRGPDALTAFRLYCKAAGLDVETPAPDFWVVTSPDTSTNTSFIVFAQPLDPDKQGWQPVQQVGAVEKALIDQLPVRDGCHKEPVCAMGVSYYWLPEEGRNTLLVQAPIPSGRSQWSNAPQNALFKVRLDRAGHGIKVDCLWQAWVEGPFLPDIAEDFDGDGYRDFVISGFGYDYTPTVILSGKDGHKLLGFRSDELDVEKDVAGPKRIGVRDRYEGRDERLTEIPGASKHLFEFSRDDGAFAAVKVAANPSAEAVSNTSGQPEEREDTVRRLFAAEVGGAEHVRAYLFQRDKRPMLAVEEIRVRPARLLRPTPELVKAGYPGRILLEYKSPSFLAREKAGQDKRAPQ